MIDATHTYSNHFTLNWPLLLLHFMAYWFIGYALYTFSYLAYTDVIDIIREDNSGESAKALQQFIQHDNTGSAISSMLIIPQLALLAGTLTVLVLSVRLCLKHRWPLGSAVAAFLLTLLFNIGGPDTAGLKFHFWRLGSLFPQLWMEFTVNGLIFLTIGLLLLFSKVSIRFIAAAQTIPGKEKPTGEPAD